MGRVVQRDPEPTSGARRMAVIATATVLGGMIAAVGVIGSDALEPRLTETTRAALDEAGLTSVQVRFEGREAILSSENASAARLAAAERIAEQVAGVRWASIVPADPGAAPSAGADPGATAAPPPTPTPTPTPTPSPDSETLRLLTGTVIPFGPDSAALSESALTRIARLAAALREHPDVRLTVTGHIAITTGTPAEVVAFSTHRAQVVVDELVRLGVSASRLAVQSAGASHPVGDNATEAGAAQNRRVTFTLQEAR